MHPITPSAWAKACENMSSITARIVREHRQLDEWMLQHQEALIAQNLQQAQASYARFYELLQAHLALEDAQLLPAHARLEKPQWRTLVYAAEHEKILQIAQLMQQRLAQPWPPAGRDRLRWIIKMIDDERSLKNLLEHHEEREEKGLLPELAAAEAFTSKK